MFIAGMTGIAEPPVNDLWTAPGEKMLLEKWRMEDTTFFNRIDQATYYMRCKIEDFLNALDKHAKPAVTGDAGRKAVRTTWTDASLISSNFSGYLMSTGNTILLSCSFS